jgi:membrane protein required for colicin V production
VTDLSITAFDVAVSVVVLISALIAVARGFLREVMSLASWIGAAIVAWLAYPEVRPLLAEVMGAGIVADLVTALVVFLVPLIVLRVLTGMLAEGVAGLGLGGLDRIVGLAFGLARGAFIVCAAYLLGTYIVDPRRFPPWVTEAVLEPPVRGGAIWLAGLLPDGVTADGRAAVEGALERAREGRAEDGAPPAAPDGPGTGYGRQPREELNRLIERVR